MDVTSLAQLLSAHGPFTVLTGAGMSTDSGIPDYRGSGVDRRRRPPITYREFMRSPQTRRRYWARSHVGYRFVGSARPNAGHIALAELQRTGALGRLITQNVDGLHQRGGSRDVVDLHGRLDRVVCTACRDLTPRDVFGRRLAELNPTFAARALEIAPDGDADLDDEEAATFTVPACLVCRGLLKPDVVFFGESMPRERRDAASVLLAGSAGLLVLGSSLAVMSGYRLVLQAAKAGQPVAIVTRGPSRGDHLAAVKVDDSLSDVLSQLRARSDMVSF